MSKCNNRFATIDLGTNTVNLLIADKENEQIVPIFENHQIICLGEGIAKTKNMYTFHNMCVNLSDACEFIGFL